MQDLALRLKHYFANAVIIWVAIIIYRSNKYYANYLSDNTQLTLLILALTYTIGGLLYYLFIPSHRVKRNKGMVFIDSIARLAKEFRTYFSKFVNDTSHPLPKISKEEKNTLLFLLVKLFFLPLMINFFFGNYNAVVNAIPRFNDPEVVFSLYGFNTLFYPTFIALLFLIDTLYFAFGYAIESSFLKNKIRSVEPTMFGWLVALLTYPPFNDFFGNYVNWYSYDMVKFGGDVTTMLVRLVIILLFIVYVSATIALGAKCSNLTNRGIVSRGPYKFVRHPAYIAKNLAWWIMMLPIISWKAILSMAVWTGLYFFRAITEERHLIKDPDYRKYVKKVKYRFIPKIF